MPDIFGILFDGSVREVAHIGNVEHRFRRPLFRATLQLIHYLAVHVAAVRVASTLIVIAKVNQRIYWIAVTAALPVKDIRCQSASVPDVALHLFIIVAGLICNPAYRQQHHSSAVLPKTKIFSSPTCSCVSTFAIQRTNGERAVQEQISYCTGARKLRIPPARNLLQTGRQRE